MALTNFAALSNEQLTIWSRDVWKQARNHSFIEKFLGKGHNSMIQHVTELKKTVKGTRAVITLLADLEGDGVAGDRTLEGNEGSPITHEQVIRYDMIRYGERLEGRMADQKSVVEFRENARDALGYWLGDRRDQLAFLTLAGLDYSVKNSGGIRNGSDFRKLEFAEDIRASTPKRTYRWDSTTKTLVPNAATSDVTAADTLTWAALMEAKTIAKETYMRGVREKGGEDVFHVFLSPFAFLRLKNDPDYIANLRHAQPRDSSNPLFSGNTVKIDGLYIHEFSHVPNTRLAPTGSKWGAAGDVDGCHALFCGAQALAMADIGNPLWEEETFDYKNQLGISVGKMIGFLKPQFESQYMGHTLEDHGVLKLLVAQ